MRQSYRRREHNRSLRSAMRKAVKNVRAVTMATRLNADMLVGIEEKVRLAQVHLGKSAKIGLIKKNTARRLQSRLMKSVNRAKSTVSGS